jgi:hypothetical protein
MAMARSPKSIETRPTTALNSSIATSANGTAHAQRARGAVGRPTSCDCRPGQRSRCAGSGKCPRCLGKGVVLAFEPYIVVKTKAQGRPRFQWRRLQADSGGTLIADPRIDGKDSFSFGQEIWIFAVIRVTRILGPVRGERPSRT